MPGISNSTCLNCGGPLGGRYCQACGQAASTTRLRVKEILGDAVSHLLNLDSKIPRTVLGLTLNPGRVVAEYVEGRRASYVPPFRYCLIVVAGMLLLYVALDVNVVNVTATSTAPDVEMQQRVGQLRTEMVRIVNARLNLVIFLALPLLGLVVRGLFRRAGHNYAECMVYVFFVMGQVFLLGIPFALLQPLAPRASVILRLLLQIAYLTWAAVEFFGEPRLRATLKTILATFVYMLAVVSLLLAIVGPRLFELLRQTGATL